LRSEYYNIDNTAENVTM